MPIVTSEKVRKLQRTLYQQAKGHASWKAWSLYGDLCRSDVLSEALAQVIRNDGAPGVDGVSVRPLKASRELREKFLAELQGELRARRYRPSPVRRVHIEKDNGKLRPLGIPTVKDRVVQTAAVILLLPIFEADMHPHSYAYRPRRNAWQAVDAIKRALLSGRTEVLDADLSAYFDNIPHARLLKLVARRVSDGTLLGLIKAWLSAPIVEEDRDGTRRIQPNRRGTPQGGVISPLLANLYLDELDKAVPERTGDAAVMVRYADDFVICCRPGLGERIKARTQRWLTARGLKLNEEKTRLVDLRETHSHLDFVGFRVGYRVSPRTGGKYPHAEPSPKSQARLREAVREKLQRSTLWRDPLEVVAELNRSVRGWAAYFRPGNSGGVFRKTQQWVNNRLRRWLYRKHGGKGAIWKGRSWEVLHERYGLYQLPRMSL